MALCAMACGILFLFFDWKSKEAITLGTVYNTSKMVDNFYQKYRRLPISLNEVPLKDVPNDAWGKPLIYIKTSHDSYTLGSHGKTGRRGGTGLYYLFEMEDVAPRFGTRVTYEEALGGPPAATKRQTQTDDG